MKKIKNKINNILDLLFFRPMSYLILKGDKCKNIFIKPLYFMACSIIFLLNLIVMFGLFGILMFGLMIIILSAILSLFNNYPDFQLVLFMGIMIYGACFYLVNFSKDKED